MCLWEAKTFEATLAPPLTSHITQHVNTLILSHKRTMFLRALAPMIGRERHNSLKINCSFHTEKEISTHTCCVSYSALCLRTNVHEWKNNNDKLH